MKKLSASIAFLLTCLPIWVAASSSSSYDFYRVIPLITASTSENSDPLLVNPWGFILTPENNVVVANQGTSTSTLYTPNAAGINFNPGTKAPIRPTTFINVASNPTGVVNNLSEKSFHFGINNHKTNPAEYLYATEEGTILAYNRHVDPLNAIIVIDNSSSGSVYKGLEKAHINGESYVYAADFHNGKVDVFNRKFKFVKSFTDPTIPPGFAPFNVKRIDDKLYVTYAKQLPPNNVNDDPGLGNGFVVIFNLQGKLIKRLISNGPLNSPWGIALAPSKFGDFSNALLIANHGDGTINAFHPKTGAFLGQLFDATNSTISISGLWGITFNLYNPQRPKLYYTAGTAGGTDGVMGFILYAANDFKY